MPPAVQSVPNAINNHYISLEYTPKWLANKFFSFEIRKSDSTKHGTSPVYMQNNIKKEFN